VAELSLVAEAEPGSLAAFVRTWPDGLTKRGWAFALHTLDGPPALVFVPDEPPREGIVLLDQAGLEPGTEGVRGAIRYERGPEGGCWRWAPEVAPCAG
jgi:hypothetical protein